MRRRGRFVADTNTLISRFLLPTSIPAAAITKAVSSGVLLFSPDSLDELVRVLERPKFDRYVDRVARRRLIIELAGVSEWVSITESVSACRDPKDDKILEVALNGHADLIITGDRDLLALHPFRSIPIVTPAAFVDNQLRDGDHR